MATIDLDMDDMFDDHEEDNDQEAARRQDNEGGDQEGEGELGEEALSKLKKIKGGAAKKRVQKPQPKLDGTRLTGNRGIPILPDLFKDMKFKGKGHEASDLKKMMHTMEHWAHRLFPKMPFDEVLERCERLGAKKEVQTCVKKMRMDMPILDRDFVNKEEPDEASDDNRASGTDEDDGWDEVMRGRDKNPPSILNGDVSPRPASNPGQYTQTATPRTPTEFPPRTPGSSSLTAEQVARIERNKRLAMEKRSAKKNILGGTPGKSFTDSQPQTPISQSKQQAPDRAISPNTEANTPGSGDTQTSASQAATCGERQTEEELLKTLDDDEDDDSVAMESDNLVTTETSIKNKSTAHRTSDGLSSDIPNGIDETNERMELRLESDSDEAVSTDAVAMDAEDCDEQREPITPRPETQTFGEYTATQSQSLSIL